VASQTARAEDPAPEPSEAAPTPTEAPKQKEPFFGDRSRCTSKLAGRRRSTDIQNPLTSGSQSNSMSELSFERKQVGSDHDRLDASPGPRSVSVHVYSSADGISSSTPPDFSKVLRVLRPTNSLTEAGSCGTSRSRTDSDRDRTPPVWTIADDANGNAQPDPTTVRLSDHYRLPHRERTFRSRNQVQTWDLYYRREYGGVKIRAGGLRGLRYHELRRCHRHTLLVDGSGVARPDSANTDGVVHDFWSCSNRTDGSGGPSGSGVVSSSIFSGKRFDALRLAQVAIPLGNARCADSGPFTVSHATRPQ
jgi:hypothetical protein